MPTRVLLVDDHDLIRQGLRRSFERDEAFEVVGEAGTIASAISQAASAHPHVVVIDVRLPDGSGLDAVSTLREHHPTMGIVVLTMYSGDEYLLGALEAGASAYVAKDAPASDVLAAARHAAATPSSFSGPDLAGAIRRRAATDRDRLSDRELQVLRLLADGLSVAALAKVLFISESTAKSHISKIYDKLGVVNRAQAMVAALRMGVLRS